MKSVEKEKLTDMFSKIFIFVPNHYITNESGESDSGTEELKHETISLDLGKQIQEGRRAKGLSQKDLAIKTNVKRQIINDYEAGRGIPNHKVLIKIERVLRIKLLGQDHGKCKPQQAPISKK